MGVGCLIREPINKKCKRAKGTTGLPLNPKPETQEALEVSPEVGIRLDAPRVCARVLFKTDLVESLLNCRTGCFNCFAALLLLQSLFENEQCLVDVVKGGEFP